MSSFKMRDKYFLATLSVGIFNISKSMRACSVEKNRGICLLTGV